MDADGRIRRVGLLLLVITTSLTGRAFAQAAAPGISGAGGPWVGDYMGLPINEAARFKAESWDARIYNAKEHQTILQPGAYWILSPGGIRISNIISQ